MSRRTKAGRRAALRAWALVLDPAARAAADGLRRAVAPLVERAAEGTRETIRLDALLDGLGPCARDLVTRTHLAFAVDDAGRCPCVECAVRRGAPASARAPRP